jgi:uncharacterized protein (DUF1501 family)
MLGWAGASLAASLFSRLALAPSAARAEDARSPAAKSCIVLWMNGGPSHVDTLDPKSGGPFKDRATNVRGVRVSEHLPQLAETMDRIALVRGMTSKEGNHQRAQEIAHTGHVPNPTVRAPSIGSWIVKARGAKSSDIPAFVSLGGPSRGGGFFGDAFDPFVVQRSGELPDDLAPARPLAASRVSARRELLAGLDASFAERTGDAQAKAKQELYARATRMMAAPATRAFAVSDEPEAVRRAYGDSDFGRGCLVARRLVEAGVPFVEVTLDGWDTHQDNFERTKKLMGALDPAMATLLRELGERRMLESTLVVLMGEFGRTPRINGREGRDHHPAAFSVALAGAGVRGGTVLGQTDETGAAVVKDAVTVPDLLATMAWRLGLDPDHNEWSPSGRPIAVTEGGKPVGRLFT